MACEGAAELIQDNKLDLSLLADNTVHYPESAAQRAGWLIDFASETVGVEMNADKFHRQLPGSSEPPPLISSQPRLLPRRGPIDLGWNLYLNDEIEIDL